MKNEETGAEVYKCNLCDAKYGTKKAMKTHLTTKHKKKKNEDKNDGKSDAKNDEKSEDNVKDVSDFEYEDVDGSKSFVNDGSFVPSTQVEKTLPVEEILRFYEAGSSEFLNRSVTVTEAPEAGDETEEPPQSVIPDDTMDKIMTESGNSELTKEAEELFTEVVLLKSKLKSAEASIKEKEQRALEIETNLIDANTEIAKLNDEKETLEEDIKLKDEQNDLLVGEQNKLEESVARNSNILQQMFQERTNMKNIINKQKTTIELIEQDSRQAGMS